MTPPVSAATMPSAAAARAKGPRVFLDYDQQELDDAYDQAVYAPNRNQVNVNSVLISLIVAGNPAAGLAKGTEVNDKNFLDRFPFLAPAHQGLLQGHGGINVPTVPDIPTP